MRIKTGALFVRDQRSSLHGSSRLEYALDAHAGQKLLLRATQLESKDKPLPGEPGAHPQGQISRQREENAGALQSPIL